MKLRIIELLDRNGEKRYRIQRRIFWLFWVTVTVPGDHATYLCEYETLERAMERLLALTKQHKSRKIIQKNITCGGDVVGGDLYRRGDE